MVSELYKLRELIKFEKWAEIESNYNPDQILEMCNKILKTEFNNSFALLLRGKTYQNLKKYNKALNDFNKSL